MLLGLFGGLAIFLYGMEKMSDALKQAAGANMKNWLARLTTNRFSGVLTGAGVTAVIQSSSVTTVLVVGFTSAGLMTLNQAVGVIMGANIGTTVTAQIIAFKVTKAALAMVAIGFMMFFTSKKEKVQQYGYMVFGLGMIFLGMNMMSDAMAPLRTFAPFIDLMTHMDNVLLAILVAAVFTALVQSSSATTGIVIVLASQGFIPLETGIALAMGANIGTCVTAILASAGKGREALQASTVHVLFNVIGVLIWLPLIGLLADISIQLSPLHPELAGTERLAAEIPRQIANANTLFNLLNTLIMLPFVGAFVWLVRKWFPHKSATESTAQVQTKFIDPAFLATPDIALNQAQLEISRVGRRVSTMLALVPTLAPTGDANDQRQQLGDVRHQLEQVENEVDQLHSAILSYLGKLRREPLSAQHSARQIALVGMTDHLENIADLIVHSLLPIVSRAVKDQLEVSDAMRTTLDALQKTVNDALLNCVNGIRRQDHSLTQQALEVRRELNGLVNQVLAHQAERLADDSPNRLSVFHHEMEWVGAFKHIYTMTRRVAKMQLTSS
ncbi:Na/Pi cotransporter family protein [Maribrevibacterium harenarium]|uniref:Na/Pi cotransporter family protein n=2 Tax=Maribrevibacterium harenarium TaxID=2589817 RepID=A0A501X1H2_9GAMM|nr:Na/Pi cotransporter family protein [Maribrevibacterium harenarium]